MSRAIWFGAALGLAAALAVTGCGGDDGPAAGEDAGPGDGGASMDSGGGEAGCGDGIRRDPEVCDDGNNEAEGVNEFETARFVNLVS